MNFQWNSAHDKAFRMAKLHVPHAATLRYFDPTKPIVIECDASGVCIGYVFLQDGQTVTFMSKALSETQKCYSNIERELLAVVLTIEHLHHYIFGCHFEVKH